MICGALPPVGLAPRLRDGTPCPLPDGHDSNGTTHITTTPDGKTWTWDAFQCAYPDDCQYADDGDCCVSYGEAVA